MILAHHLILISYLFNFSCLFFSPSIFHFSLSFSLASPVTISHFCDYPFSMISGRQNQWVPVLLFLSAAGAIALGTMSQSMTLSLSPTGEVEKRKSD